MFERTLKYAHLLKIMWGKTYKSKLSNLCYLLESYLSQFLITNTYCIVTDNKQQFTDMSKNYLKKNILAKPNEHIITVAAEAQEQVQLGVHVIRDDLNYQRLI